MKGAKPNLIVINGTVAQFPPAPAWLSDAAKQEWRRMQPFLEERRFLTDVTFPTSKTIAWHRAAFANVRPISQLSPT